MPTRFKELEMKNMTNTHRLSFRALILVAFTAMFSLVPVLALTPSMANTSSVATSFVVVVQSNR